MTDKKHKQKKILIGEDDPDLNAILSDFFEKEGWLVETVQNGLAICRIVDEFQPDIVLMDIDLPGRDGIATTIILKRDINLRSEIPIILTTAFPNKEQIAKAMSAGCSDFITKPYKFDLLISKIEKNIVTTDENEPRKSVSYKEQEQEAEIIVYSREALKKAFSNAKDGKVIDKVVIHNIVNKMIKILTDEKVLPMAFKMKSYDEYTYVHSINVATLCTSFAFHLNWNVRDMQILGEGGFLHDIGKTKIDTNILTKPDKLTDAEYNEIKKHPVLGNEIVAKQNYGEEISKMILEHHESIAGTGYPYKLRNEQISKYGKLISIIDSYDAMTTDACYRRGIDSSEAVEVMSQLPDFDKELFGKFKSMVSSDIIGK